MWSLKMSYNSAVGLWLAKHNDEQTHLLSFKADFPTCSV